MTGQHYCLRWNNYQNNMTSVFHQLLQNEDFVDVTLACNDLSLKAHKVVLSACSAYFQKLLLENPCKHPTIIMPQDVGYAALKFIIEFVYKGEIDVSQSELESVLKTAEQLKIKGLCDSPGEDNHHEPDTSIFTKHQANGRRRRSSLRSTRQLFPLHKANALPPQDKEPMVKAPDPEPGASSDDIAVESNNNNNNNNGDREVAKENEMSPGRGAVSDSFGTEKKRKRSITDEESDIRDLGDAQLAQLGACVTPNPPLTVMTHHAHHHHLHMFGVVDVEDDFPPDPPAPSAIPVGHVDMHDHHSPTRTLLTNSVHVNLNLVKKELGVEESPGPGPGGGGGGGAGAPIKFETLRSSYDNNQDALLEMTTSSSGGAEHSLDGCQDDEHSVHTMMVTPELMGMVPGVSSSRLDLSSNSNSSNEVPASSFMSLKTDKNGHCDGSQTPRGHHGSGHQGGPKTWTQEDMEMALDALRNHNMSLTKASATYGIPSTTLWQRAHRMGIDTPKKEGPTKSWTEENLNNALDALRTGTISANKASKAYGIPSSTLYKIARREGIRLAAPFNAAPTTWTPEDLEKALESIRTGQTSVQKASAEFGIPTGTLYGRCKREGIELSRSNPTPWSEDAMGEALEAVRLGHMSINQAAIHYNLPYSSLYGRFKRGAKYDSDHLGVVVEQNSDTSHSFSGMDYSSHHSQHSHHHHQYNNSQNGHNQTNS